MKVGEEDVIFKLEGGLLDDLNDWYATWKSIISDNFDTYKPVFDKLEEVMITSYKDLPDAKETAFIYQCHTCTALGIDPRDSDWSWFICGSNWVDAISWPKTIALISALSLVKDKSLSWEPDCDQKVLKTVYKKYNESPHYETEGITLPEGLKEIDVNAIEFNADYVKSLELGKETTLEEIVKTDWVITTTLKVEWEWINGHWEEVKNTPIVVSNSEKIFKLAFEWKEETKEITLKTDNTFKPTDKNPALWETKVSKVVDLSKVNCKKTLCKLPWESWFVQYSDDLTFIWTSEPQEMSLKIDGLDDSEVTIAIKEWKDSLWTKAFAMFNKLIGKKTEEPKKQEVNSEDEIRQKIAKCTTQEELNKLCVECSWLPQRDIPKYRFDASADQISINGKIIKKEPLDGRYFYESFRSKRTEQIQNMQTLATSTVVSEIGDNITKLIWDTDVFWFDYSNRESVTKTLKEAFAKYIAVNCPSEPVIQVRYLELVKEIKAKTTEDTFWKGELSQKELELISGWLASNFDNLDAVRFEDTKLTDFEKNEEKNFYKHNFRQIEKNMWSEQVASTWEWENRITESEVKELNDKLAQANSLDDLSSDDFGKLSEIV